MEKSCLMIIIILFQLAISLIYAQNNRTTEYGAIAKPHPKGKINDGMTAREREKDTYDR